MKFKEEDRIRVRNSATLNKEEGVVKKVYKKTTWQYSVLLDNHVGLMQFDEGELTLIKEDGK